MKRSLTSTGLRAGSEPLAKLFGEGEPGQKPADYVCAINYGLPPPEMELWAGKKAARSNPAKPKREV